LRGTKTVYVTRHLRFFSGLMRKKDTPEFISLQPWPSNSPDLNPVDNSVWDAREGVRNKNRLSG